MPFRDNVFINITTMALIIAGGLGFIVTFEVWRLATRQRRWFKLLLQTKLMLFGTLILIVVGAALIFVFETGGSFRGMSIGSQVLASFFQSVTARTAGFNTVDIGALSNSTLMVLILLMFIGAGPGSCAGGVKVTTVGILVLAVTSRLQEKPKAQAWNRSIPADTIRRAAALFAGSIFIILLSTLALQVTELAGASVEQARAFFLPLLFEVASAWGTVGLSTGVTPGLSAAGKIIVIGVMFIGRVGPLTLAAVLIGRGHSSRSGFVYPDEDVMIG
jgi:trk system potassium uptake protein TrkH